MHPTVTDRLAMREYARGIGDANLERACNADLARFGYRDLPEPLETTLAVLEMERAVPPAPRRGRKPMPRCEHNEIIGRCGVCDQGATNE